MMIEFSFPVSDLLLYPLSYHDVTAIVISLTFQYDLNYYITDNYVITGYDLENNQ